MKKVSHFILGVFSVMLFGITSSYAAVSAAVSTALTDSAADVGTVGGLVLIAILAAMTFKYIRKAF